MKSRLIVFACFVALTGSVMAKDYAIVLSPFQEADQASEQVKQVLNFVIGLEGGDSALVIDGYHLATLGNFTIPKKAVYNNPRARLNVNREAVGSMMAFAEQARLGEGERQPSTVMAARIPQLLRQLGRTLPREEQVDVILLVSPVYDNPQDAQFSMVGGAIFPSDGHLSASRRATPFGTSDSPELLSNLRVHWGYPAGTMVHGDQYAFFIERFWALYVERLGGSLVSFLPDLGTLLRQAKSGAVAPSHNYELNVGDKLEMLILREEPPQQTIYERELTVRLPTQDQIERAEQVQVGLSWNCPLCDLDLYAQPYPDGEVLSFMNRSSPEGRYWKDFRISPQTVRGYETVEFTVPIDLRELRLVVNHFGGRTDVPIQGEVRLGIGTATYAYAFTLASRQGNGSVGVNEALTSGTAPNANTLVISPLQFLANGVGSEGGEGL